MMIDTAARLTTLTRLGFAARGLLYIVIAILVLTTGRTEDPAGALAYLESGGGRLLLILVALGLAGYGLWRLSDAAFDIERHGTGNSAVTARLGAAGSGFVHLFLAWQAVNLIKGTTAAAGNGAQDGAQSVLQLPGGGIMLIFGGFILLAVGVFQFMKAFKASFLKHLEPAIARQSWSKWIGQFGYAARGLVFVITGFFLANAGLGEQASEAGGMAEALSWLDNPWDMIVALGLLAFGLFSLIEARYRIIHNAPVGSMGQQIRSKLN